MAGPRGRLLKPVTVTVRPVDAAATVFNRNAREPVRQVARAAAIEIEAQIVFASASDPVLQKSGIEKKTSGYLVFLAADLADKGYEPSDGDRVEIPGVDAVVFLTSFEPTAYRGALHTLLIANFEDKQPTRGGAA